MICDLLLTFFHFLSIQKFIQFEKINPIFKKIEFLQLNN